jgi:FkbM family methyltransferase
MIFRIVKNAPSDIMPKCWRRDINEDKEIYKKVSSIHSDNNPRIMVEIGAYNGSEAKAYAKRGFMVYAFEANPDSYDNYLKNLKLDNLYCYYKAVVPRREDKATFYVSKKHPGACSLTRFLDSHEPITVDTVYLPDFLANKRIKQIDYLEIDAEKMDLEIMKNYDWRIKVLALKMEFGKNNIKKIYDHIMNKCPEYKHIIFEWEKPYKGYWEPGKPPSKCIRMCQISQYLKSPRGSGGNIFFYLD